MQAGDAKLAVRDQGSLRAILNTARGGNDKEFERIRRICSTSSLSDGRRAWRLLIEQRRFDRHDNSNLRKCGAFHRY
jgi:hypothetical protein